MIAHFLALRPRLLTVSLVMAAGFLLTGCGAAPKPTISGVRGKATSDGKPLPEGCLVSFVSRAGADAFSTKVNGQGEYAYKPPAGVAVPPGEYTVTVTPPGQKVITTADGLAMPDPNDKATYPQVFPKYASASTSTLKTNVTTGETTFDIDLKK